MKSLESAWSDDIPPVLLVLGAEEQAPGMIGYSTYLRLNYAVRFWRRGGVRTLVVSGRGAPTRPAEMSLAVSMRDYLLGHGVPESAILLETRATSTRENFLYSVPLMRSVPGGKGFVTSDFHSGRAAGVAARLGPDWRPIPIPDAHKRWNGWWNRWPLAWDLAQETAKRAWYRWQGWL